MGSSFVKRVCATTVGKVDWFLAVGLLSAPFASAEPIVFTQVPVSQAASDAKPNSLLFLQDRYATGSRIVLLNLDESGTEPRSLTSGFAAAADPLFSVGAAFLDFDLDGDLDLFVGNYLEFDREYNLYYAPDEFPGPLAFVGQPDHLYRNEGNGRFTNVTKVMGLDRQDGRAMGVGSFDFNDDGRDWNNYYEDDRPLASNFVNFVYTRGNVGWICTDRGLNRYDGRTWYTYRNEPHSERGILVRHDADGTTRQTKLQGRLPHNYILGIDFDQSGDLWLATADGLGHASKSPMITRREG
jgi:hypothetical protein